MNPDYQKWTAGLSEPEKAKAAFVHAATWADDIKLDRSYVRDTVDAQTATQTIGYSEKIVHDYWHYVDLPFSTGGTAVRAPDVPNALTQVQLLTATLASQAPDELKSYDLSWLLHLVGDLHQRLRATSRFSNGLDDDRGGNDEKVQPANGPVVNLQAFWDGQLGDKATPAAAIAAARELPTPDPAEAAVTDPALWIIESFALAQNEVYAGLIGGGAGPYNLTNEYEDSALATAEERAALAARVSRIRSTRRCDSGIRSLPPTGEARLVTSVLRTHLIHSGGRVGNQGNGS